MFIFWLIHTLNINQRYFFFPVNYNKCRDLLMPLSSRVSSSLNKAFTPSLKRSRNMWLEGHNDSKSKKKSHHDYEISSGLFRVIIITNYIYR